MPWRDRLTDLREVVEDRTGLTVQRSERVSYLEEADLERRSLQRELDLLAYTALDYATGNNQELKPEERRKLVQKARVVWMRDPQAGAAVDLMNDFVFGSGLPKPKANDPLVQEVVDEAWDDPDNKLVLTRPPAQLALGTDLSLQSNLFLLLFDDGEDGKVKLGILDHDSVETVVRDENNRLRVLWYLAKTKVYKWDFEKDMPAQLDAAARQQQKPKYYEHFENVKLAEDAGDAVERPPSKKLGEGLVYHVAINRGTEMVFGHPIMDRTLRWYNAYNAFMEARLDIIRARAAFVMKKKIKGTPSQLEKEATRALSRRSALVKQDPIMPEASPKPASILSENESVDHEEMSLDTASANAQGDAQMLRSQVSAAHRFPQSYFGDATNSNLATATSLELPVLKAVETRQEVFEGIVRMFIDRVIERAVESGRIKKDLSPEERQALKDADPREQTPYEDDDEMDPHDVQRLAAGYEDQPQDEEDTQRDLGYEFKMPSPLKRMMTDLLTGIQTIATTFDPNNTNPELSRVLLTVALGEGLELEDPAGAVEKIYPPGYKDPALAAAEAQQQPMVPPDGGGQFGEFGPPTSTGADGQQHSAANPYGAQQRSQPPEVAMQQALVLRDRQGEPIHMLPVRRQRRALEEVASTRDEVISEAFREAMVEAFGNGNGRK